MGKPKNIQSFEQALANERKESIRLFKTHVNPEEAALFKLADLDKRYVRAEGAMLYDDEGKSYFDLTAGYGSLNLGHNPPEVLDAVRKAASLPAVLLAGHNSLVGALASNLSYLLPGDLEIATFGSGGAEGVEIALKTARGSTRRKKLLSCCNAYHGLSLGAMSVCCSEKYCNAMGPLLDNCESVPFGDLVALESKLRGGEVAAFIVEPIQGEGGAIVAPKGYLKTAEELCHRYGSLLILDEIQTGFGRTGKMFALEHEGVVPDIVVLSKSLGSGVVPISASVTTADIWKKAFGSREKFDLAISTFGGNPAACAAALKTIDIMRRDRIPEKAAELGTYAASRLEKLKQEHETIAEVRGQGLFLGIKLAPTGVGGKMLGENFSATVIARLLSNHGILTSYYDLDSTVVRFEPPLIVTKEQIDKAVDSIDAVLGKSAGGLMMSLGKNIIKRSVAGV